MTDAFSIFIDPRFNGVFSQTASLQGAKDEVNVDVESLHAEARDAISSAVRATRSGDADPNARIALILGEAGFGKTHLLAASLRRLAVQGQLYPAVIQMTSPVTDDDYDRWMLEAVIRELNNPYFAIPRLGDDTKTLLGLLPASDAAQFRRPCRTRTGRSARGLPRRSRRALSRNGSAVPPASLRPRRNILRNCW